MPIAPHPIWKVSYFKGPDAKPRQQFKTWHVPKDQQGVRVKHGTWWRIRISGPGIRYEGIRRISTGTELLLRNGEANKFEAALRKNRHRKFVIELVERVPTPKVD